jgi:hypothetical protein
VGADHVISQLHTFLTRHDGSRWIALSGDYGSGKTHILYLLRMLAQRSGFATCYLSADAYGAALNHPQRFLPSLLATLELPGRSLCGYETMINQLLLGTSGVSELRNIIQPYLVTGRQLDRTVRLHIDTLVTARMSDAYDEESLSHSREAIAHHLAGHSIRHRSGLHSRLMAYVLLKLAERVATAHNLRGILILLDEVESIYTKLSFAARRGAYRVLAAFCESSFLSDCYVALGITPDAWRELALSSTTIRRHKEVESSLEPVRALADVVLNGPHLVQCRPLTKDARRSLLRHLRALYLRAYPQPIDCPRAEVAWTSFVTASIEHDRPVRILIREAVSFLDSARYTSTHGDSAIPRL